MAKTLSEAMTIEEIADFLRLSTRTIKRLMDEGHLSFCKIGHSVRFSRRRLIELIDNGVNTNLGPRVIRSRK
jgi:excisionase family DNA binding protein